MKIRLFSDLHLEFSDYKFDHIWKPTAGDRDTVAVLAGDIGVGRGAKPFVEELCKNFKAVVYLLGNHEFYHHRWEDVIEYWTEYNAFSNFYFMNNRAVEFDNVRIIGGTMWTSLDNHNPIIEIHARQGLNDYRYIKFGDRKLHPMRTGLEFENFKEFLDEQLSLPYEGKTVVVTHHSPGDWQKRSTYGNDPLNFAYYAQLESFIANQSKINLWLHGHTHQVADYMVGETRVVCNPYGYHRSQEVANFEPNWILTV